MALVCPQLPFQWVIFFLWVVKRQGGEYDHQLPSSEGVNNEWRYSSTPPTCLHDVARDNFTFTFLYYGHCPNKDHNTITTLSNLQLLA